MKFTLKDQADPSRTLNGEVVANNGNIEIRFDGYGEHDANPEHGSPIVVEVWEGHLRCLCFADINSCDVSHIIDLEGARESNRVEESDPPA